MQTQRLGTQEQLQTALVALEQAEVTFQASSAAGPAAAFGPQLQDIADAQKASHVVGGRALIDGAGAVELLDAAGIHDRHPRAQVEGLELIVRDVDAGKTQLAVYGPQMRAQLDPQQGVQVGQRLVQQHHLGPGGQGARQCNALLLTAAEHGRVTVGQVAALHHLQHLTRALRAVWAAAGAQRILHIALHGHVRPQRVVLEHHADVAQMGGLVQASGRIEHRLALKHNAPFLRVLQARDAAQQRGLAAAAGPQQHKHFTGLHIHVYMVDRNDLVPARITLDKIFYLQFLHDLTLLLR